MHLWGSPFARPLCGFPGGCWPKHTFCFSAYVGSLDSTASIVNTGDGDMEEVNLNSEQWAIHALYFKQGDNCLELTISLGTGLY